MATAIGTVKIATICQGMRPLDRLRTLNSREFFNRLFS
jgi:hypothetical protein